MAKRKFDLWVKTLTDNIYTYEYYTNFKKAYSNLNDIKIELNILNSLIGSHNIEVEFENILIKYPEVLKCIPILLAVRYYEISVMDKGSNILFNFNKNNISIEMYKRFMQKTGLFDLLKNHIIKDLNDYVLGIEVGLDSNARKNRSGILMENLVEDYIKKSGFKLNMNYFKQIDTYQISKNWNLDLSKITNNGKSRKKFDFVILTNNIVYGIETNFYKTSGSKLNETARSYKNIAINTKGIKGFEFIWITDGKGWLDAKNNLEETFDVLDKLYNINDLVNGALDKIKKPAF